MPFHYNISKDPHVLDRIMKRLHNKATVNCSNRKTTIKDERSHVSRTPKRKEKKTRENFKNRGEITAFHNFLLVCLQRRKKKRQRRGER
jgi:hypothetical protein